jgi:transcription-repair coupling factor (superfamily II helicase)
VAATVAFDDHLASESSYTANTVRMSDPTSTRTASAFAPPIPRDAGTRHWGRLHGCAPALALARTAATAETALIVVAASAREAEQLGEEIAFFAAAERDLPVLTFPDWETLPYDAFAPHPDIIATRLTTLARLPDLSRGVLVLNVGTLLQRIAPRAFVDGSSLQLRVGDRLAIDATRRRLDEAGYVAVAQVHEHGEYAVRGSLLDLFPTGGEVPYRIDLFDDEIESIRSFDPQTQRSIEKLEQISLLPAREFPLTEEGINRFRSAYRRRFEGDPSRAVIYADVSRGVPPGGVEYYLPLFFERTASLFDYIPGDAMFAWHEGLESAIEASWAELESRYDQLAHDIERPILTPDELSLQPARVLEVLGGRPGIVIASHELDLELTPAHSANFTSTPPPLLPMDPRAERPARKLIDFVEGLDGRTLVVVETAGRREQLHDSLRDTGLNLKPVEGWSGFLEATEPLCVTVAQLERGLILAETGLALITETQLLGERARRRSRRRAEVDPEAIVRDLTDLREGAPVVHEEYGVGRYLGLTTLEVGSTTNEFLTLEYAGGDKLYVPVHALHLITRYTGASPEAAPLHRLGTDQWARAKAKAAKRIRDVAAELLDIYARRAARKGHAFKVPEREFAVFSSGFPFEETIDQQSAIEAVVGDLRAPQPMDRIVCGDVGFGKTEVAMRAAFVAVQDGQQVAVLVPTTLLAQQHYQTFSDRFADWPIRVEVISRFRTGKQMNSVLKDLAEGKVDIIIGTHRLLQSQVKFNNLGLVIVDEEQRFGVSQKERLRKLRAEVDLLTLTATPIPRTLNMAMGGVRDLSLITTPPEDRLGVKTFITHWNPALIREAFLREIKRGGQLFFVHNSVETIEATAAKLEELVPEATIRIGHGQMRERDLEQVMLDFYHRRFNTLVSTTIIESGIDIPTANTIIIDRADRFGLAQLHQMRGRVGRSHHRAYAYLIAPPREVMTADAVKRLEAIESLEELGAGFALATHDLEIRGAGELLGDEQSGQIQEIGFALYTDLLSRAVEALKRGEVPDLESSGEHGPEIDLHSPALFPEEYMPDVHMRLVMYKRIASTETDAGLDELKVEMIDRFGLLPEPAQLLFELAHLRVRAMPLGIVKIDAGSASGRFEFRANAGVDPARLIALLQSDPRAYRLDGQTTLRFKVEMADVADRVRVIMGLLQQLSGIG